jgi:hypothetical protein
MKSFYRDKKLLAYVFTYPTPPKCLYDPLENFLGVSVWKASLEIRDGYVYLVITNRGTQTRFEGR